MLDSGQSHSTPSWPVGRALVDAAAEWAKSRGGTELGSDTEIYNLNSIKAHLAWGFEARERVVYFRKKL